MMEDIPELVRKLLKIRRGSVLRLRRNFWQRAPTFLADHRNRVTASTPAKCHAVAPINHTFICTLSFRPSTNDTGEEVERPTDKKVASTK